MKKIIAIVIVIIMIISLTFIFAENIGIKRCSQTGGYFECYWIWDIPKYGPSNLN
ncbi:MAG: hypothetical protein WC608_01845 [Parcubacteria group bacterium]